ncbi:LPS translocon maturation chaperone LptM [Usitatibacter rugosus]|nr:lipoprotein [Usitatibacter rugosus]
MIRALAAALILAFACAACGQKGPLKLPTPEPAKDKPVSGTP